MDKKIVLITGASSGFGFLISLALAKKNFIVIATMRNLTNAPRLRKAASTSSISEKNLAIYRLDVTNIDEITELKKTIHKKYGRLDILINNAGFSQGGVIEEVNMEKWYQQFQTNFFGVVSVTKAFIPMMREARSGKIIQMGSISGRIGLPGLGPYASSKFALAGLSESLRLELKPFNVYTSMIEAGSFQTNIWDKGLESAVQSDKLDYQSLMTFMNRYAKVKTKSSENPQKVVDLVTRICESSRPNFRYSIGKGIKSSIFLKSLLPWSILETILYRIFNKV
ncbi:SDR family oxidoreductase [Salipaludibacillus sp. HK11]|uniref:SDR family oxidoreductase n=1 Tax=Salipaludibacillus sp. HK11 TaxID=3394320 RepID=UPI0039FCF0FA